MIKEIATTRTRLFVAPLANKKTYKFEHTRNEITSICTG